MEQVSACCGAEFRAMETNDEKWYMCLKCCGATELKIKQLDV